MFANHDSAYSDDELPPVELTGDDDTIVLESRVGSNFLDLAERALELAKETNKKVTIVWDESKEFKVTKSMTLQGICQEFVERILPNKPKKQRELMAYWEKEMKLSTAQKTFKERVLSLLKRK